jgi:hypothetical protein
MHRRLVYASQTTKPLSTSELAALVALSQRNNARADLTGLLIHDAGMFFQVIEGPHANVATLFDRILRDPRHTDVTVLEQEDIALRGFPAWKMSYARPMDLPEGPRTAVLSLTRLASFNSPERGRDAHIRALVRTFLDCMRDLQDGAV